MSDAKALTPEEWRQKQVDDYNAEPGNLNERDGYNCTICKNRGDIAELDDHPGSAGYKLVMCKCDAARRSIARMKQSGLGDVIREKTFDKYEVTEPWQKTIKDAAIAYAKDPKGWFFIGGQSGAGKSHICTAICREFLLKGNSVAYMLWVDEVAKLVASVNDAERYEKLITPWKEAKVLYIDDLFKTMNGNDGKKALPTNSEVKRAFEIINHRLGNPKLRTIISSECTVDEICQIDEAVGGRIFENSVVLNLAPDMSRNYRLRKAVTV